MKRSSRNRSPSYGREQRNTEGVIEDRPLGATVLAVYVPMFTNAKIMS